MAILLSHGLLLALAQVEDFDINGQPRVMVLQIRSRAKLSLCAPTYMLCPQTWLCIACIGLVTCCDQRKGTSEGRSPDTWAGCNVDSTIIIHPK